MNYPVPVRPLDKDNPLQINKGTELLSLIWLAASRNKTRISYITFGLSNFLKQYFIHDYKTEFKDDKIIIPEYDLDDIERKILNLNYLIFTTRRMGMYNYINVSSIDEFVISVFEAAGYRRQGYCLYI